MANNGTDYFILMENDNFTLSSVINGPAVAVVVGLEMIAALLTNTFVILISLCHPLPRTNWRQPSYILLTNMLFVNLTAALFVLPFVVIASAAGEWVFGDTLEVKIATCQFAGYMYWYIVILLTVTLTTISTDRFLFIVKPTFYRRFITTGVALSLAIISWLVSALINSTPFFGLGKFAYSESPGSCFPVWEGQRAYLGYFVLIFAILLAIIIVTSVWTFCFTRLFLKRTRSLDSERECHRISNIYNSRQRRLLGIFGTLAIVYVVSFTPPSIYLVTRLAFAVPLQVLPAVLIMFFSIIIFSPLVQYFFRKDIKDALIDILRSYHCLQQQQSRYQSKSERETCTVQMSTIHR